MKKKTADDKNLENLPNKLIQSNVHVVTWYGIYGSTKERCSPWIHRLPEISLFYMLDVYCRYFADPGTTNIQIRVRVCPDIEGPRKMILF